MTPLITVEDLAAAHLCAIAANRLRVGPSALSRLTPAEIQACEAIARAAIDAERGLRQCKE